MSATQFVTDIPRQCIILNGETFTAAEASPRQGRPSLLQERFIQRYGATSFPASLAGFLAEWFDGNARIRVHTSGSTGTPKEMWVEKRRMMNSALLTLSFLKLQAGDTAHLCMPLQYIAGKMMVVRALTGGLNLILTAPCGHPMEHLTEVPMFSAMVPMQVYNSLQVPAERKRLEQVRHLIIGGGAIDHELAEALHDFPHHIWSTYGMTETLSHIALRPLNGENASTWYTPFDQVGISLSETGTLVIDAPLVCEGKLVTNDIGLLNDSGQFRITGRIDNTVNTGGVKVQIEEVEEALKPHLPVPFLITSTPDARFGERIVLLIQGEETDAMRQSATNACLLLPTYWRPKQYVFLPLLPQTGTGKPDRARAKALAKAHRPESPTPEG